MRFLLPLLFCFFPLIGIAQPVFLTAEDEISLLRVSEAKVEIQTKEGVQSFTTDEKGRCRLPDNWQSLTVTHPDYEPLMISKEELTSMNFKLYLERKVFNLSEVVLTAGKFEEEKRKIPFQIEVIKAEEIELLNPQTSADILAQNGSVFVQKSQMGGGSPVLRGFEANKVMLVIDGVRMNNAIYRGGHLQNVITIDPNMIDRTEVLFGPSSVLYGSDALGGVIHFYSRRPRLGSSEKPLFKANAMVRYASANQEKTGHFDINLGFKKWGFISSATVSDFGDLRTGNVRRPEYPDFGKRPDYVQRIDGKDTVLQNDNVNLQTPSGYTQYDFMQKFFFLQSEHVKHDLNLQYSTSTDVPRYDRLTERRNGQLRRSEWYYGPQDRLMAVYKLNLFAERGIYDRMNVTLSYQDIRESRHTRGFGDPWRNDRKEQVNIYSANLDATKQLGKHELQYGLEASHNDVQSGAEALNIETQETETLDTRYPDGGSWMRFLAAYAGDKWTLSEQWRLSGGLRFTDIRLNSRFSDKSFFPFLPDEIDQHSSAISANLGGVWTGENGWRVTLLASTGFRTPNVDDVGKVFESVPGTVIVPNPDVMPEYTYNGELSLGKTFEDRLEVDLTGWYTFYDNALVVRNFTVDGQDSIYYEGVLSRVQANVNAKQAFITGVNANFELKIVRHLLWTGTVTWTFGQDLSEGVPLDHIPPFYGRSTVEYRGKRVDAQFYVMFNGWKRLDRYSPSGEDNLPFATPDGMPSWATLNLKASVALNPNLRIQAGLENILDVHYRNFASGISAPGRNLVLALRGTL